MLNIFMDVLTDEVSVDMAHALIIRKFRCICATAKQATTVADVSTASMIALKTAASMANVLTAFKRTHVSVTRATRETTVRPRKGFQLKKGS